MVLECVVGPTVREQWRQVAVGAGARFWIVDTICSDLDLHRQLFQGRGATERGDWVLTWETVEGYRATFRSHPDAAYVADAVRPVDKNVRAILGVIDRTL